MLIAFKICYHVSINYKNLKQKNMAQKIILIGEDEKNISEMYEMAFEQAGFKVVTAFNGKEVIEKTKTEDPHLILLDINMPVKDGFEVLKNITEDLPLYKIFNRIPIIVLSNYSNSQDIEYCLKKGAQDYLIKSDWTPNALVKKVKNYLDEFDKL